MTKVTARAVENLDVLHRLATPAEGDTGAGVGRELGRDKSNFAKTLGLLRGDGLVGEGLELTPAGQRVVRLFRPDGEIRVPGDMLELRHRELEPDPENERSEIPDADVEDMAATLGDRGQLQPIRVRPPATPGGKHRILIGELRWRGVGLAIERGAWPTDRPLRCQLVSETDALQLVLMRMDENLRRHDLHELDEGRGFKRLRDEFGRSTAQIAELFGRSRRHVQDRIFVFENADAATQARMRLPEKDPRHVRYTDARDDATNHKSDRQAEGRPPARPEEDKPAQPSPPAQPGPASPPPPPQPAGEGFTLHPADAALKPVALRQLAELAHKIHDEPALKGAKAAAVYAPVRDEGARFLRDFGFVRFFQHGPQEAAVITDKGREWLEQPGRPRISGAPYKAVWLNAPPAHGSTAKPRSEAHALIGDDFSRQIREAAAEAEAGPAPTELAGEPATPAGRAVPYVELGGGGDIGLFLPGVGLAVALTADEARTLAKALAGAADQVEWDPPSAGGTGHDLSGAQRASLLLLLKAGAIGRDCAKTAYGDLRPLNPSVLARLWKRGLTDSRVRTEKGRSLTVYWLTEAGADVARQFDGDA